MSNYVVHAERGRELANKLLFHRFVLLFPVNLLSFSYLIAQAKTLENWFELGATVLFWIVTMAAHGDPLQQYLTSRYSIRGNAVYYEDQKCFVQLNLAELNYARETGFGHIWRLVLMRFVFQKLL